MATTAHTEAPGGHKAPFPPFQSETFASQLVWFALTFVALYLLASRLLLPRVGGIIDARANKIEGDLSEAQRFKAEADEANQAYEKALADARNRAQALANATRDEQQAKADARRKELEGQLDAKLAALTAHRSQYPVDPRIFPRHMLLEMYGKEHFVRTGSTSDHGADRPNAQGASCDPSGRDRPVP